MFDKIKENFLFFELQKKDKVAFAKFYDLYVDKMYQYIYFRVGDENEAQDLTSELFLKIWDYIQKEKNSLKKKKLNAFVYTVARNLIIDHYRKSNKYKETISLEEEIRGEKDFSDGIRIKDTIADEKQNLEENYSQEKELEDIKNKLFNLKDEYREILTLKYINELSTSEIADILKKTNGNVRITTYRALKALKDLMSKPENN